MDTNNNTKFDLFTKQVGRRGLLKGGLGAGLGLLFANRLTGASAQDANESSDNSDLNTANENWRLDLGWTPGDGTCPSLTDVQKAFGKDGDKISVGKGCQFVYDDPGHPIDLTCPKGYYATSDRGPLNKMFVCADKPIRVEALTIYPAIDFVNECDYARSEVYYAEHVMNGSIFIIPGSKELDSCPGVADEVKRAKAAGVTNSSNSTGWCSNIKDAADAASKIGGTADNWTDGKAGDGKIVYSGPNTNTLKRPDGKGTFDTSDGNALNQDVTGVTDATYNCPAA